LINFGNFQIEAIDYDEIDQFTGENGNVIKPSRRDARFIEVKLRCKANETGEFCLYPSMFSTLFCYRGIAQAVPAVAMGTKIVDKMTGETREYWYNEPEVSIILGVKKDETITKYFVLEIPKEVDDFIFQGPMAIQMLILRN
jgi:hypothetical protein